MIYAVNCTLIVTYLWGLFLGLSGWGLLATRLARHQNQNFAINLTLGSGIFIFLGGVLNLLNIAFGWTFDCLLLAGIVLSATTIKSCLHIKKQETEWLYWTISALLIAIIMIFIIGTQLPPKAYNYHDDFERFFRYTLFIVFGTSHNGSKFLRVSSELYTDL